MSKYTIFLFCLISILSCKNHSNSEYRSAPTNGNNAYVLKFMPDSGIRYHYDISRSIEYKLDVNEKKVNKQSRLNAGIYYNIGKDSSGNFIITIQFDKIQIYSKNGDKETEERTTQPVNPFDPVSKMLHALKTAKISTTVTPAGKVKSITGYKRIENGILSNMNIPNAAERKMVRQKLDQLIGSHLIKGNVEQFFQFLPDSAVHIGSEWKRNLTRKNAITMDVKTTYTLQSVEQGQADISLKSDIISNSNTVNFMGTRVTANLKGHQKGKYEVETRTGMLTKGTASSNIKGTLQMVGRRVPIQIESEITINGKKVD